MTWSLVRKLLRDICVAWIVVAVLLFLFQLLWSRITMRVTTEILTALQRAGVSLDFLQNVLMGRNEFMGQMVQAIIGGENIALDRPGDMMSIAYVHPLVMTILGIWALGRAANAIAGEIDRGTMELLLAQPIRRTQVILAHLLVDAIVIPSLCLAMWTGTYLGTYWMGLQDLPRGRVEPTRFLPALLCVFALLFAISGVTIAMSAAGRSRARVWGWAMSLFLGMFLVNVVGQIWDEPIAAWIILGLMLALSLYGLVVLWRTLNLRHVGVSLALLALAWLGYAAYHAQAPADGMRQLTLYYHYQPQGLIQHADWYQEPTTWLHLGVLFAFGVGGYTVAWITFSRRDLPAPL